MAKQTKQERHRKRRKEKHRQKQRRKEADRAAGYAAWAVESFWDADPTQAASYAEKALRINPDNIDARRILITIAGERNDGISLERHARALVRSAPDWRAYDALADALKSQGKYVEAVSHYERALDLIGPKPAKDLRRARKEIQKCIGACKWMEERETLWRGSPALRKASGTEGAPGKLRRVGRSLPASPSTPQVPPKTDRFRRPAPEAPVAYRFDATEVRDRLTAGEYDTLESYRLNIEAHRILFVAGYDDLLCLNTVCNVERLAYQVETARRVLRQFRGRALLCDEVGLGKTIEAGMIIKEYVMRGLVRRLLVLVPPSLVSQWTEELASKFALEFVTTDGPAYRRNPAEFWSRNDRIISSLATAKSTRNFSHVTDNQYDMVVIDEAHHLKNRTTLNWKLANSVRSRFLLMLTATPVQNNLLELHNLITVLRPGQLKTAGVFRKKFQKKGEPLTPANREELRGLLAEVMVRNRRSDVNIDLPRRYASTVRLSLDDDEADLYRRVTEFVRDRFPREPSSRRLLLMTLQMEAGSSPFALASTLEKLAASCPFEDAAHEMKELAGSAGAIVSSAKGRHLLEVIQEKREQKIVFTRYLATQRHIASLLEGAGVSHTLFSGDMPSAAKDASVERFRKGEAEVFLSTESGGEGRNLQFCNTVFNYDLPWNPMRIEQRIGRVHRIGQTKEVFIFNLSAKETLEDYLLDILDRKINMFELVVGEVEMILGNLTDERDFPDIVMQLWAGAKSHEDAASRFKDLGEKILSAKTHYEETKSLDEALFADDYEV